LIQGDIHIPTVTQTAAGNAAVPAGQPARGEVYTAAMLTGSAACGCRSAPPGGGTETRTAITSYGLPTVVTNLNRRDHQHG
jgi:hypothetical protein